MKKLIRLYTAILLIISLFSSTVSAQTDGAILAKIYTNLAAQLKELKDQIEVAREISNDTQQALNLAKQAKAEYDFVQNFNLEDELNSLRAQLSDLSPETDLESIRASTDRINAIFRTVDKYTVSPESSDSLQNTSDLLGQQQESVAIAQNAFMLEAERAGSENRPYKAFQSSIAVTNAFLAAEAAAMRQQRLDEKKDKLESVSKALENDQVILNLFNHKN